MAPKEFINHLIKEVVEPALKREGFTADHTTFRKLEEGFVKVFNIQYSAFNTPISASFYINVGLYFPAAYGILSPSWLELDKPLPQKVKIEHCQTQYRADDLTNRPQAFLVDWQTEVKQVEKNVQEEIADVLTWFASMKKVKDCLAAQLKTYPPRRQCDFYVALTCAEQADIASATEIVKSYISQYNGPANTLAKILAETNKRGMQV